GNKIARLLGVSVADNFYAFKGSKLDLIMTQVGESHALLIGMPSAGTALPQMDKIYAVVQKGAHDLQTILADMGVALTAPAESLPGEPLSTPLEELETFQETFEIDPGLDALFAKVDKTSLEADLDSFWEVSPVEDTGIFAGADALSYEQARQLGLAPNEEG
ncbi:MAG TPA: hypothetical protein PK530_07690, partial [Anaerolineales bacterium]|nr:hypothetical protein [Anaerolineales bacterium]